MFELKLAGHDEILQGASSSEPT